MTPDIAKLLREPFPAEHIGKLPRVWCKPCRDAQWKVCTDHQKRRCDGCGNNITTAHLHLDYVGHAEITDRLLAADPGWTWEPVAFGADGLPVLDRHGGLWIRLTVAGVTRLGFGHADGKQGPDAVKEAIGDALRNAAMRFGVALDLWGAKFKDVDTGDPADEKGVESINTPGDAEEVVPAKPVDEHQLKIIHTLFSGVGFGGEANRDGRLTVMSAIVGRALTTSKDLTATEASAVIAELRRKAASLPPKEGQE